PPATRGAAVFDHVNLTGSAPADDWGQDTVGGSAGGVRRGGGTFTVTGSGNIAPNAADAGGGLERTLIGTFVALTVLTVLAVLFVTTEYRRGMIRTSFAATPHRSRVLAAKAVVVGAVAFGSGLGAAAGAVPGCQRVLAGQ